MREGRASARRRMESEVICLLLSAATCQYVRAMLTLLGGTDRKFDGLNGTLPFRLDG